MQFWQKFEDDNLLLPLLFLFRLVNLSILPPPFYFRQGIPRATFHRGQRDNEIDDRVISPVASQTLGILGESTKLLADILTLSLSSVHAMSSG